jgi:Polymer-forming cytoskeletal
MSQTATAFSAPISGTATPDEPHGHEPHSHGLSDVSTPGAFQTSLKTHKICFVVPVGAKIDGHTIDLPGGILILGALRGRVRCVTGSAIIAKGGEFQGKLEADDVVVEGKITSPIDAAGVIIPSSMSEIRARGQTDDQGNVMGGILAFSAHSFACAKLFGVSFQVPRTADLSRSILHSIGK